MHPYTPASRETQCKEKWGVGGIAQMFAQMLSVNECEWASLNTVFTVVNSY